MSINIFERIPGRARLPRRSSAKGHSVRAALKTTRRLSRRRSSPDSFRQIGQISPIGPPSLLQ